ncbi:aldo-keto reductase family 1 member B1-like [Galleria mellonella]|uniref:Aldo-keto reductase family 1 member B1-like n=1 Tax=Galleria mellonella TaxID=7137 RepID=A0ABM3MVB4_GALME|nr:aldo-keto reductase family 1 member B1-like [Galleria mellonella]
MASRVPKVRFNNNLECPVLGLGTWKSKPGEVTQAVKDAIDVGYRHFDCAYVYGNEKEVGVALTDKINSGAVRREDLFITSKLWNTFHRPDLVRGVLNTTLKNLNLQYLDLYLIHWPQAYKEEAGSLFPVDANGKLQFSNVDFVDTWKEMEGLVRDGLVRSIGVSNFNRRQLERVLQAATIKPVTNQIESHPYLNQKRLKAFCEERGIIITAYSPLGSPDRPWAKPGEPLLLEDPKLKAIADRIGKSVAQVLIRYQIDRGTIVIPKSVTKSRIAANFDVFDFTLSKEDIALIDTFDCNGRICPESSAFDHPDHPFRNDEY